MRKIESEETREAKKKRNATFIGIFMLGILVIGTVGYGFISGPGISTSDTGPNIPDRTITNVGNQWAVNYQGQVFYFSNPPEDLEDIKIDITNDLYTYYSIPIYIVSDNTGVTTQIATLLSGYTSRIQQACYGPCEDNLPEKDCSENLIVWQDKSENKIYQEENCVFIEGDLRSVDAFLYRMLGMI